MSCKIPRHLLILICLSLSAFFAAFFAFFADPPLYTFKYTHFVLLYILWECESHTHQTAASSSASSPTTSLYGSNPPSSPMTPPSSLRSWQISRARESRVWKLEASASLSSASPLISKSIYFLYFRIGKTCTHSRNNKLNAPLHPRTHTPMHAHVPA